jgi:excisionase family DNA binding protein
VVHRLAPSLEGHSPEPQPGRVVKPQIGTTLSSHNAEAENLLKPAEVAALFRVDPKTVTRWAKAGKIGSIRTLGGHRRFRASEIRKFLEQVDESTEL